MLSSGKVQCHFSSVCPSQTQNSIELECPISLIKEVLSKTPQKGALPGEGIDITKKPQQAQ